MKEYTDLVELIRVCGVDKPDRTGTGTRSYFGHQMRFNLQDGFPLLTLKKTNFNAIMIELLWFLKGNTNIKWLKENGCNIWNEWANAAGDLGPVYGEQWRSWQGGSGETIDQIANVIAGLKNDPHGRRHIVSAWNPDVLPLNGVAPCDQAELGYMALAPCHTLFQFYVSPMSAMDQAKWFIKHHGMEKLATTDHLTPNQLIPIVEELKRTLKVKVPENKLSCQLYQRSADVFLGVPFNIASYALLTHMIAQVCGYGVGDFIHTLGDAHLYSNHEEQVETMMCRIPKTLPSLWLNPEIKSIDSFTPYDIYVQDYVSHPFIKAPVAV